MAKPGDAPARMHRQQYFGEVRRREEHPGFALTRLRHSQGRRIPVHSHRNAYFTLLVGGGYSERFGPTEVEYPARSVLFHPPGIVHRDEIAPGGASFLIVELDPSLYLRATELGPAPGRISAAARWRRRPGAWSARAALPARR